jgi:hypothetical protein
METLDPLPPIISVADVEGVVTELRAVKMLIARMPLSSRPLWRAVVMPIARHIGVAIVYGNIDTLIGRVQSHTFRA